MTDTQHETSGPSEVAHFVASLVPALPAQTAADLRRMLARQLSMYNPSVVRHQRLGLLIDLIACGTGEVPTTRQYEDLRAERTERGEQWPAHSSLHAAYGSWLNAVRAAMWLHRDGLGAKVPAANHHRSYTAPYLRDEVVDAITACRDALGTWPTDSEYDEWRLLSYDLARNTGNPTPRLPQGNVMRRLFGSYDDAFRAAKRRS